MTYKDKGSYESSPPCSTRHQFLARRDVTNGVLISLLCQLYFTSVRSLCCCCGVRAYLMRVHVCSREWLGVCECALPTSDVLAAYSVRVHERARVWVSEWVSASLLPLRRVLTCWCAFLIYMLHVRCVCVRASEWVRTLMLFALWFESLNSLHAATHRNTLQHTECAHCNTSHHTATHRNKQQHPGCAHCSTSQ